MCRPFPSLRFFALRKNRLNTQKNNRIYFMHHILQLATHTHIHTDDIRNQIERRLRRLPVKRIYLTYASHQKDFDVTTNCQTIAYAKH